MNKKINNFLKNKKTIYIMIAIILVGVIGYFFFSNKNNKNETLTLLPSEFLQQVSVSGKVVPIEDLNLSFEQSGMVKSVLVKVGDKVSSGKLIASQDTFQLSAQLLEMQAGIDLQKAKLNQLLAGASSEDIKIAEDAIFSAKENLKNAYQSSLVLLNTSYNAIYNAYTVSLYVKNNYFLGTDGQSIKVQGAQDNINDLMLESKLNLDKAILGTNNDIDSVMTKMSLNLMNTYNYLKIIREQCDLDIYYSRVTSADKTSLDSQKNNINTASTGLVSNKQTIDSYKSALNQAENQLSLVSAKPRETDVAVFKAQIKQAEAGLQNIITQIRKKQIFSPINGTITKVNAKVGSVLNLQETAISLISNGKFQIESYVPEIYISLVKIGDKADVTLDAYGTDKIFKAKVVSIDPAETFKDGVSTYKTKLEFEDTNEDIKTGMSANLIITTEEKSNVISVPQGVIKSRNGKKYVEIKEGNNTVEKEIVIGDYSSSGQVEILSGLKEGDIVIIK